MIWRSTRPRWRGGWCLWLEAEEELAALRAGRDWRAAARVPDAVRHGAARTLLGADASFDEGGARAGSPESGRGFAWAPTPRALDLLRARGWTPPPAPTWQSLSTANARESFLHLSPLPGCVSCRSTEEVLAAIGSRAPARPSGKVPAWILRASLCAAGQDRLVVEGPCERAASFARERLPGGPIDVAPMVEIVEEFAIHGRVGADGELQAGRPVRYADTARPAARAPSFGPAAPDVTTALGRAFERVGEELVAMGYFGPVGIDAFTWRDHEGTVRLRAVSEVNARYTQSFGLCAPALVGLEHPA